jgi:hypothetical protein
MLYHYCDPDEPETCPNRNEILRKFVASLETIFKVVRRPFATASEIAAILPQFTAREIDWVLLDTDLQPVAFDGERAYPLVARAAPTRYQLAAEYCPAETARIYFEAFQRCNHTA